MNDAITTAHAAYREAVAAARAAEEAKTRAAAALAEAVEAAKAPASPIILEFELQVAGRGPERQTVDWSQWRLSMDDVAEFLNVEVAEVEKWDEDRWLDAARELDCVNDGDSGYLTESLTSPVPFTVREYDASVPFWARADYVPISDDEA